MKVLAIGAHFDDVELGCGGALARHAENGDEVIVFVATDSGYQDPSQRVIRDSGTARAEGEAAAKILGVSQLICGEFKTNYLEFNDELACSLLSVIERHKPNLIYTHWGGDVHHDHQNLSKATMAAGRHVPCILMYRSNCYDSSEVFVGNFYVDITATLGKKKNAIMAHESECRRVGESWVSFFVNQAENDGKKVGVKYAESFQVVKYLV